MSTARRLASPVSGSVKARRRTSSSRSVWAMPGRHDRGEDGREVRVGRVEDGRPDGPGHVQLAPRPPVQHDRGDDAAAPAAPAQRGHPVPAASAVPRRGPAGPPGPSAAVSTQALGSPPPAHRSCRNSAISGNWCTGYVSSSGNSSSPSARSPAFTSTRSRPQLALPDRQRGEAPAERLPRAVRRRPPGLARRVGRGHGLRQRNHGPQPGILSTHSSSLGRFGAV